MSEPQRGPSAGAETIPASTDGPSYLSHRQILITLGGLMAGMLLAALDQSIVGTALPASSATSAAWTSCPGWSRRTS